MLPGSAVSVELNGRMIALSPMRVKHYAEIERRIVAMQPDPLKTATDGLAGLSAENARALLALAYDKATRVKYATPGEIYAWLDTTAGAACLLWLLARDAAPDMTEQDVLAAYENERFGRRSAIDEALQKALADAGPEGN